MRSLNNKPDLKKDQCEALTENETMFLNEHTQLKK